MGTVHGLLGLLLNSSAVVMAFAGRSTAAGMGVLDDLTQLSPLSGVAIIASVDWRDCTSTILSGVS